MTRPSDSVPPHDIDAECALIGSVLLDAHVMPAPCSMVAQALGSVRPSDFYYGPHGNLWRLILEAHGQGRRPSVQVLDFDQDHSLREVAASCAAAGGLPSQAAWLASRGVDKARRRSVIDAAVRLIDGATNGANAAQLADLTAAVKCAGEGGFGGRAPPLEVLNLAGLMSASDERLTWAVPGILAYGQSTILHGMMKDGKTLLALDLAAALARGDDEWCGLRLSGKPVPVLFLTETHGSAIVEASELKLRLGTEHLFFATASAASMALRTLDDVLTSTAEAMARTGAMVVIIDTLAHWGRVTGEGQENDNALMGSVCRAIRSRLAIERGAAVMLCDHSNKGRDADPIAGLRGAGAKSGEVDAVIRLSRVGPEGDRRRRLRGRGRMEANNQDWIVELDLEMRGFRRAQSPAETRDAKDDQRLLRAVAELEAERPNAPGFGVDPIRERAGMRPKRARDQLAWLSRADGPLTHDSTSGYRRKS